MSKSVCKAVVLALALSAVLTIPVFALQSAGVAEDSASAPQAAPLAPSDVVTVTILHTNDFHGQLEPDYKGRGGSAYVAGAVDAVRADKGADNVALLDAGDIYLAAQPVSQLLLGEPTIDIYNLMGYEVAAFGNHEFDKGQAVLISRTMESNFPWVGANIVVSGTAWTHPAWVKPYVTVTVGSPTSVTLGIIGLDTDETPTVTIKGATEGLVFKDLTDTVLHYYDEVMAQADALIVLAHMGTENSGPHKGLETVAQELINAGKPVDLMIGGHQHEPLFDPVMVTSTAIIEAGYYGRWLGQADVTIDPATKKLTLVDYGLITITDKLTANTVISDRVAYWVDQVVTQTSKVVGHTYISLTRDYNNESIMGDLVSDGMLWKADEYDDGAVNGSVEIAFTNAGGLREDIEVAGTLPYTLTWGDTFKVLPFGNTLFLMDMTGAQIQTMLDQSAKLYKGLLQASGITYSWYNDDADAYSPAPTIWGASNAMVNGQPLSSTQVYRVVTNDFMAGGSDGWTAFADGTNRWNTYYDMQEGVNEYISTTISPIEASDIVTGRFTYLELSVEKDVMPTFGAPGSVVTYTVSIANNGDGDVTGVVITDTLPPEVDFGGWVSAGSAIPPGPTDGKIVWGPWTVEKDKSIEYVFTATVTAGTAAYKVRNTVDFTSANAGSGSDDAIFTVETYIYLPIVMRNAVGTLGR